VEAFLVSTFVVALAEIGDKTQLLAFMLAARYKEPLPIIAGIFVATIVNHALAGWLGVWVTSWFSPTSLRWILAAAFFAMAVWILIPDKLNQEQAPAAAPLGIFGLTVVAFFMAEMGDKTQIATVAMAAHYHLAMAVVIGSTAGMMIANVPAVIVGDRLAGKIPLRWVHGLAAMIFFGLGLATILIKT
jgi:Ca2+/H+ antiporter, TMEM165/GDT1 family